MIIYCIYQHQKIASKSATFSVLIEHQMIFKSKHLCEPQFLDFAVSQSDYMFVLDFYILLYSYSYFFFMCLLLILISINFTFQFLFRSHFCLYFLQSCIFEGITWFIAQKENFMNTWAKEDVCKTCETFCYRNLVFPASLDATAIFLF